MKRILILTDLLPYPLNSGGAQAQFNILNELRKRHRIRIIFMQCSRNTLAACKELQQLWPDVEFSHFSYLSQLANPQFLADKAVRAMKLFAMRNNKSFIVERAVKPYGVYPTRSCKNWIDSNIASFQPDIVQLEFYPMLRLGHLLPSEMKKVFVHHEIRFIRNERLLNQISLTPHQQALMNKVKQDEINDLNVFDTIITLTEQDKSILQANGVTAQVHVSPAAVNSHVIPYREGKGKLVYLGGHRHIPNKEGMDWFSEKVLPLLSDEAQQGIDIVGAGWPNSYSERYGYNLRGFVDKIDDALCGNILIVPLLTGSGMRMKILDAAAMGVPFITTSVGKEGLNFNNGESCIIADTPDDFAKGIKALMSDKNLRRKLAEAAQEVFNANYSIAKLASVREQVYAD